MGKNYIDRNTVISHDDIDKCLTHISRLQERIKELEEGIKEILTQTVPYHVEKRLKRILGG